MAINNNSAAKADDIVKKWIASSDKDYSAMMDLFRSKRYNWALFLGHLVIEKLLKAYYFKIHNDYPPFIHNLLRISELSGLILNEDKNKDLAEITTFNINARYDDYKLSFYKRCTKKYTANWIGKIKFYRQWIKTSILS
ncbi:MAG: HEPN domain-containing protein [Bacteroidetes bacterium]|nr:HEPN domain-containing protein [Bacteroidota bacterium]